MSGYSEHGSAQLDGQLRRQYQECKSQLGHTNRARGQEEVQGGEEAHRSESYPYTLINASLYPPALMGVVAMVLGWGGDEGDYRNGVVVAVVAVVNVVIMEVTVALVGMVVLMLIILVVSDGDGYGGPGKGVVDNDGGGGSGRDDDSDDVDEDIGGGADGDNGDDVMVLGGSDGRG